MSASINIVFVIPQSSAFSISCDNIVSQDIPPEIRERPSPYRPLPRHLFGSQHNKRIHPAFENRQQGFRCHKVEWVLVHVLLSSEP